MLPFCNGTLTAGARPIGLIKPGILAFCRLGCRSPIKRRDTARIAPKCTRKDRLYISTKCTTQ